MQSSKVIFPLLLCTLALSFAAVALIVNGAIRTPSSKEVAQLCKEQLSTLQTNTSACTSSSTTGEIPPQKVSIPPSTILPGFSYPNTWNAVATPPTTTSQKTIVTFGSSGILTLCDTCTSGVLFTLTSEPYTLATDTLLDTAVQNTYATLPDNTIQKESLSNGTKYTISGTSTERGPFTDILFFGSTTKIHISFSNNPAVLPPEHSERQAFLSSLDFSLIP